jgi:hypothetical protein
VILIGLLAGFGLVTGCVFFKLKEEIKTLQSQVGIGGEITRGFPQQKPLIVILYGDVDGRKQIRNFKVLAPSDEFYYFLVPQGEYSIGAYEDANANFNYDDGEYFGIVGRSGPVRISSLKPLDDLHLAMVETTGWPPEFPSDISTVSHVPDIRNIAIGTITTLDDERFSDENANKGLWQPLTFLRDAGTGVYFLESYDPERIPILFVHGAAGSPRNFETLAAHIDRSHYQPWFFHYPSGIPLAKISRLLNNLISDLHEEHGFDTLFVTAHSMGGLVSRAFILKNVYDDGHDYIRLFVSISSPFGGLEVARKGVENAPVVIPSWHDMVPGSEFIEHIFSRTLSGKLDCYLLFSYRGACSLFMENNDGSVTLRSQLDLRAQEDALEKWGFDEGHVSILSSPDVLAKYAEILARVDGEGGTRLRLFGMND